MTSQNERIIVSPSFLATQSRRATRLRHVIQLGVDPMHQLDNTLAFCIVLLRGIHDRIMIPSIWLFITEQTSFVIVLLATGQIFGDFASIGLPADFRNLLATRRLGFLAIPLLTIEIFTLFFDILQNGRNEKLLLLLFPNGLYHHSSWLPRKIISSTTFFGQTILFMTFHVIKRIVGLCVAKSGLMLKKIGNNLS